MGRMLRIKAAVVKFGEILCCRFGVILWSQFAKGKFIQLFMSYNTRYTKVPKTKANTSKPKGVHYIWLNSMV